VGNVIHVGEITVIDIVMEIKHLVELIVGSRVHSLRRDDTRSNWTGVPQVMEKVRREFCWVTDGWSGTEQVLPE
jgi:hypothetical protein